MNPSEGIRNPLATTMQAFGDKNIDSVVVLGEAAQVAKGRSKTHSGKDEVEAWKCDGKAHVKHGEASATERKEHGRGSPQQGSPAW